jgi:small subunit ribosomal protein S17
MQSTTVVRVDRRVAHPKYGKYFTVSKRFKIHSPEVTLDLGDIVQFEECRPISRDKRWRYIATLKKVA